MSFESQKMEQLSEDAILAGTILQALRDLPEFTENDELLIQWLQSLPDSQSMFAQQQRLRNERFRQNNGHDIISDQLRALRDAFRGAFGRM